ncbi:MAG: hypothetical protein PHW77_07695 [Eubacteriales bacterium]|nr:hypothetical protein [Eubacteriales bacterium]
MKKVLIVLLSLTVFFSCFAAFFINASAEADDYLDLRPVIDGNAQYSADGATVEVKTNGTAVITLTATSATVVMTYKNSGAIYQEAYVNVETAGYVKYFYELSSAAMTLDIHAHYDRGNKDNADLYLSGMKSSPTYFELSGDNYGVWDMYQYLSERSGYLPADNIIKFSDITYTIGGAVGDTFTLYYYELADDYDEDFGTVIPDEGTIDLSEEESSEESSIEASETSTEPDDEGYDFMSTAVNVQINEAVGGETVRIFTTNEALAASDTKWSVNVLLKKVGDNLYEVVSVAAGDGNIYAGTLGTDEILLAVHSSSSNPEDIGTYQNVYGKLAALALEAGDKLTIVGIDGGTITVLETYSESEEESSVVSAEASDDASDETSNGTPITGDTGIIALAVISVIALAGVVVIKKR